VEVVEIPEDLNVVAKYPISALKEAPNKELAGEWVELVLGKEGQRVLAENGFEPAG
jgi:molybdate transport system substrate-binding protein